LIGELFLFTGHNRGPISSENVVALCDVNENAFQYIDKYHKDLWLIHNDTTFRGWYIGGSIKMGYIPTVAWLLYGTPEDPTKKSWGGQFIKKTGTLKLVD